MVEEIPIPVTAALTHYLKEQRNREGLNQPDVSGLDVFGTVF